MDYSQLDGVSLQIGWFGGERFGAMALGILFCTGSELELRIQDSNLAIAMNPYKSTYINLYEFMSIDIAIYVHIYIYIQNPYIIMMIAIIMRWNHQPGIVHIYIDKLYNIV